MSFMDALAKSKNVDIKLALQDVPLVTLADAGQLQQVLSNLLMNAIQAMPNGGAINVRLDHGEFRPPAITRDDVHLCDYARIDVKDEGTGISRDHLHHIFDPFFTTKEVGEGTGLGLSIAYGIVEDHGGWIDVESVVGQGSCFSVYLPLVADESPRMPPVQSLPSVSTEVA
jgi:two-component system, NtrC family, sensor kinase